MKYVVGVGFRGLILSQCAVPVSKFVEEINVNEFLFSEIGNIFFGYNLAIVFKMENKI